MRTRDLLNVAAVAVLALAAVAGAVFAVGRLIRESYPPVAAEAARAAVATPSAFRGFIPAPPAPAPDLIPVPVVAPGPIITPAPFPMPAPEPITITRTVEVPPPGLIAERDTLKARADAAEARLVDAQALARAQLVAEQARSKAFAADVGRENAALRRQIGELLGSAPGLAPPAYPAYGYVRTGP